MKNLLLLTTIILFVVMSGSIDAQWVQVNNGMGNVAVSSFIAIGNNIFAGVRDLGVYLSTDNGTSWTQTSLNNQSVISLAVNGNNIFAGTFNGVYLSTNNGTTWNPTPLNNRIVLSLAINGNDVLAGTANSYGVYISTDNGTNWTQTSLNNRTVYRIAVNGNYIFAGTAFNYGVYVSTNNGTTWTQTSLNNLSAWELAVNGTNVFAGVGIYQGVYKSTDNGTAWNPTSLNNQEMYALTAYGNNIFAGTVDSGVFVSTDNGESWTQRNEGLFDVWVNDFFILNDYIFCATHSFSVFRRLLDEIIPVELISFTASVTGNAVTLSWTTATEINNLGFEVQRSTSNSEFVTVGFVEGNGTTTEQQEYSYIDRNVTAGKYFYRLKQIDYDGSFDYSDVVEVDAAPVSFSLEQNYPNPFNPITNISYTLPTESQVKLSIYNSLGEIVETIINEKQDAGKYDAIWNASNYPSGVYIYTLDAVSLNGNEKTKISKKMILLR